LHGGYKSDSGDTIRDNRLLDSPDRRRNRHEYHSSYGFDRHDDRYYYHPYRRSDRGYLPDEFMKAKPPTSEAKMKKS